jgi:hypothetical protein
LLQACDRLREIHQAALGGFHQNAQRADHRQFPLSRDAACGLIIQDEPVRAEFLCKSNGFTLAGA